MTFEKQLEDMEEVERIRTIVKMVLDEERAKGVTFNAAHINIHIQPLEMSHVDEELDALYKDAEERIQSIY